jgi:hypothetical protein
MEVVSLVEQTKASLLPCQGSMIVQLPTGPESDRARRRGELLYLVEIYGHWRGGHGWQRAWCARILAERLPEVGLVWPGPLDMVTIADELRSVRARDVDPVRGRYTRLRGWGVPVWAAVAAGLPHEPLARPLGTLP